ncbi:ABC transporter permease subunit [Singulisphaera rosea]
MMVPFLALIRKHSTEARWVLILSCLAFFGLSILTVWLTLRFERLAASEDFDKAARNLGFFKRLGGPEMDGSTLALEISFWNHPLIVLTVLGWAITRGAAAVGGEIERGTLDLILSRPTSRSAFLASHIAYTVFGLVALAAALIVGDLIGNQVFPVKSPANLLAYLRPGLMVITLGMGVYGYTLPFSTIDLVRWRPSLIASAITLAGLIALTVAPQFEGYDWLEKLSVLRAYAPVTVAMKGDPLAFNAGVLVLIFGAGVGLSFLLFSARDLPTNS